MGIIRNGILGGFSNKTGPLVGVKCGKLNIIRSLPVKTVKPPSQAQINQRFKFGMVSSLLSAISELIIPGYTPRSGHAVPMQTAIAYHLKHAIDLTSANFNFDYSKLCFSRGDLALPSLLTVEASVDQQIEFSWNGEGKENHFRSFEDRCTVLIYNPVTSNFHYLINAAKRRDGQFTLQCPADYMGCEVYTYISFQSALFKRMVSPSTFLGRVLLL